MNNDLEQLVKVKELVEILNKCDQEQEVVIDFEESGPEEGWNTICDVTHGEFNGELMLSINRQL